MIDIIYFIIGLIIAYIGWLGLLESSKMLTERSILRKFTGAYYDFEITEALEEMNLTREQAIKQYKDKK
jgi:hypothetical protein|tara:strand:+ start:285 stop:491 length:207 start_codon:yes stop_codon:yes gene_type:complete